MVTSWSFRDHAMTTKTLTYLGNYLMSLYPTYEMGQCHDNVMVVTVTSKQNNNAINNGIKISQLYYDNEMITS